MKNHTFYILIDFREKKGEKYGPDFEKKPGKDRDRDHRRALAFFSLMTNASVILHAFT